MAEERSFDARLDTVPMTPGVYLMKDASGEIIYVGKAKKLRNRLRSYFGGGTITNPKVAAMVSHVSDFEYTVVGSEEEALLLENNFIKRYTPKYNILLRDDKGYPYICITRNEEYPRVFKAFRVDKKLREKGALYYGPYMNSDLQKVLKTIDEIFPLKKCRKVFPRDIGKERPCLNYHIGKCMAPCLGTVTSDEYRQMVGKIVLFFEGKYDGLEEELEDEMQRYSENLEFEKAAVIRDRLEALKNIRSNQRIFLEIERDVDAVGLWSDAGEMCIRKLELRSGRIVGSSTFFVTGTEDDRDEILTRFLMQYYESATTIPPTISVPFEPTDSEACEEYLSGLVGHKVHLKVAMRGELLTLQKLAEDNAREMMVRRILRGGNAGADPNAPVNVLESLMGVPKGYVKRIESYDISNLGNDDICAGMVVFEGGKPNRQAYRLFRLKEVTTQDDFASMREVLTRRFSHDAKDGFALPDLILADGGIGQVHAIASVVRAFPGTENIKILGMVKNDRHKTSGLVFEDGREIKFEGRDLSDGEVAVFRFLTTVQNEVHRFAISYQRKLSGKRNLRYKLENIRGIGPSKRRKLLAHFGTIKAISQADLEALKVCPGISASDAEEIYLYFRKEDV